MTDAKVEYGEVVPLKYGAARLTGDLIAYFDFTPEKRTDPSPNAARHDFAPSIGRKP